MKFVRNGNKIVCRRHGVPPKTIVEFDAHVNRVPPHVAAQITAQECQALERFLADRQQIRSCSTAQSVLDALPAMMDHASETLESEVSLDQTLHDRLFDSIQQLNEAVANVSVVSDSAVTPIRAMTDRAVLKERLEVIKEQL